MAYYSWLTGGFARAAARLGSANRLYWLVLLIVMGVIFILARMVEPFSLAVFKQLTALFVIDSLIFFFVDRFHAKMGLLTLIFLLIMELLVILFYGLSLYAGATL